MIAVAPPVTYGVPEAPLRGVAQIGTPRDQATVSNQDSLSLQPSTRLIPVGPADAMAQGLFFLYQKGAAPSKGQRCPMYPSCSEYGRQAVVKHGLLMGVLMAADRIHRCGHDLRYYPIVWEHQQASYFDPVPNDRP